MPSRQAATEEARSRLVRRSPIGVDDVIGDRCVQRLPFEERGRHPGAGVRVEPRAMFGSGGPCCELRPRSHEARRRSRRSATRLGRRRRGSHRQPRRRSPAVEGRRPTPGPPTPPGASQPRHAPRGARAASSHGRARTSSSLSAYGQPVASASRRPIVDLPLPIIPTSRTRHGPSTVTPVWRSSSSSQASSRGVCSA